MENSLDFNIQLGEI